MDIIIYRVEDENGVGFGTKLSGEKSDFFGDLTVWSVVLGNGCSYDLDANLHPAPDNDEILMKNLKERDITEYTFAFSSAQQMRNWLYRDKWLISLEKFGMVINKCIIDSDYVILGEKQCIYLKDKVTYKAEEKITEYFGIN